MGIKINIHKTHRQYTDNKDIVEATGTTVGECLNDLINNYPDMEEMLFDNKGKLQHTIEIYINLESAYPDELEKPVKDGDELHITVMLAGG